MTQHKHPFYLIMEVTVLLQKKFPKLNICVSLFSTTLVWNFFQSIIIHQVILHTYARMCLDHYDYQWCKNVLNCSPTETCDLVQCHKGVLKRNIHVISILILRFTIGSTGHLRKGWGSQLAPRPVGITDVNILLLLWDFNQKWPVLINFAEKPKLEISCTPSK